MDELTLATISLCATDDVQNNVATAVNDCKQAAAQGADWILLPEMFSYHGPYEKLQDAADEPRGMLHQRFSKLAQDLKAVIFAGSWPEKIPAADHGKVGNVSYVFGRDGNEIGSYRKTHLFNLLDSDGKKLYCESDGYQAGDQVTVVDVEGWRVGLSTCYDLRFPSLYQKMIVDKPVDMITVPSAFTYETGRDHWEILLRARAIELQAYVFAANQVGEHRPGKVSYGHSMLVDPWGAVVANTKDSVGLAVGKIQKSHIQKVRARLPALSNRRPELY